MSALLIALGLGASAAIVVLTRRWSYQRHSDLGTVSHQWLSEQRMSQTQNSQR